MAKSYVLWGSAGHAKVLAEIIKNQGDKVVALFDNRVVDPALPGVPIYHGAEGFFSWASAQDDLNDVSGLAAIGGALGRDRVAIHDLFRSKSLRIPVLSHPSAIISPTAQIGVGAQLLSLSIVAADSRIGEACIINHRASVDHECVLGNGVHLAPGATLCGCVNVGDYAFIGAGAVVLPRLFIGQDAVVGAGAVVIHDVPAGATVVGNPARVVKLRDRR